MEITIDEMIELLEETAREKDYQFGYPDSEPSDSKLSGSKITTHSAVQMRNIARMLKEQMSTATPATPTEKKNGSKMKGEKKMESKMEIVIHVRSGQTIDQVMSKVSSIQKCYPDAKIRVEAEM